LVREAACCRSPAAGTWARKPFCNRVNNLKGREGWSAFLGTNHFNNLQSLIVEAILITTGSESAFIFSINGRDDFHREFAGPERSCGFDSRPWHQ
jgi:hypothetical protein